MIKEEEGEYEETAWIEMREDEDDEGDLNCGGMFDDPDPLDVFEHEFCLNGGTESESRIAIAVEGYKAENGQQLNSTGLTLWRAAPLLCEFLTQNVNKYISGKYVLELGAGLGLCGILAGSLGAASVYMTDGDSDSLSRMRQNVARNKQIITKGCGTIHCKQLRWGRHLTEFKKHCALPTPNGKFDVIMGSDIIYTQDILDPLFKTVDFLLKDNSNDVNGFFLLAYARRNVKIDYVFETAEKYGFQWTMPDHCEGCFIFSRKKD